MQTVETMILSSSESLLWTILRRFEELAYKQYQSYLPDLVTGEKKDLVDLLSSQVPTNNALESTDLSNPLDELLSVATGSDAKQTLIIQGLILEVLGQTLYQMFVDKRIFSSITRNLCTVGIKANEITRTKTQKLIEERIGIGEELFQSFIAISKPIIIQLDALGGLLDQHFSEHFNISFSDLLGEFVAEILPLCLELGMDRKKIVAYLTSVLMGI